MLVKIAKPFERKREKEDKETKILFFFCWGRKSTLQIAHVHTLKWNFLKLKETVLNVKIPYNY